MRGKVFQGGKLMAWAASALATNGGRAYESATSRAGSIRPSILAALGPRRCNIQVADAQYILQLLIYQQYMIDSNCTNRTLASCRFLGIGSGAQTLSNPFEVTLRHVCGANAASMRRILPAERKPQQPFNVFQD